MPKSRLYKHVWSTQWEKREDATTKKVHAAFHKAQAYLQWWDSTGDIHAYAHIFYHWLAEVQPHELEGFFNEHEIMELLIEDEN